ncbi:hypothetical protein [Sphingopyxis sp.]|uniref:hypothetical protein n=1 Tax=Sphingopyxis sp. TaxID=1908224 RepID=UPI0025F00323|nr:hypothetical protein [Sphingopyxis sp.]
MLELANACFAFAAAFGWRHSLLATIRSAVSDATESLGKLHLAALLLVIAACLFALAKLRRPAADGANPGVATATLLTALLFLVDMAPLGGIDALLQRKANGLPVIGWLWISLGAATVLAALSAARCSGANMR